MEWVLVLVAVLIVGGLLATAALGMWVDRVRAARAALREPATGEETFFEALRRVPLGLVITVDVLDLLLDFFATPIVWVLLDRLGYKALRKVAAVEALIPFTQPIPTMTICWLIARATGPEGFSRAGGSPGVKRVENVADAPARGAR